MEIPDHELLLLKNGIYAYTWGYQEEEEGRILLFLGYTPDDEGSKVINGRRYRKRFFEKNCSLNSEMRSHYQLEDVITSPLENYLLRVPQSMVLQSFDPFAGYLAAREQEGTGELLLQVEEIIGGDSNLGLTGSTLLRCSTARDLDILVAGKDAYLIILERVARAKQEGVVSPAPTGDFHRVLERKREFYNGVTPDSLRVIFSRKKHYKLHLPGGKEVSLSVRLLDNEIPRIAVTSLGAAVQPYRLRIESVEMGKFCPFIYYCEGGKILVSYDLLFKGAFQPGDFLTVEGEAARVALYGQCHQGILFHHDGRLSVDPWN